MFIDQNLPFLFPQDILACHSYFIFHKVKISCRLKYGSVFLFIVVRLVIA